MQQKKDIHMIDTNFYKSSQDVHELQRKINDLKAQVISKEENLTNLRRRNSELTQAKLMIKKVIKLRPDGHSEILFIRTVTSTAAGLIIEVS